MNKNLDSTKRPIVFIFDRVMHYHKATLKEIEKKLSQAGIEMWILSAQDRAGAVGRVAAAGKTIANHLHFSLTEKPIAGFQIRYQHDLVKLLNQLNPSVIVSMCHSGTITEWNMLKWAKKNKCRCVAWQCGYEYKPGSKIKAAALKRFIPKFDFHLCYHTNAKHYAMTYGASEEQTLVMHNTIDERVIVAGEKSVAKTNLTAKHPELLNKKIILYVGAVLKEKNLEMIFDALSMCKTKDAFFILVGDGPHLHNLKLEYRNRTDWISTGSIIAGVAEYFDAADVFVLPGTGGLAINESMAHRLPVISGYADGSADDLVMNGINGYILKETTVTELADRIDDILSNEELRSKMGVEGERMIRGHLSFDSFIERVLTTLTHQHSLSFN